MRLSTKRIDQIFNISITVQQNIQGKLTRINYFKLASQGEIMIVLHLQKDGTVERFNDTTKMTTKFLCFILKIVLYIA